MSDEVFASSERKHSPPRGGESGWLRDLPLRAKLTALFLLFAALPLTTLAFINYVRNRAILIQTANDGLQTAAGLTAQELDAYFSQKLAMTAAEARLANVAHYLELSAAGAISQSDFRAMQDFIYSLALQDALYLRSISLISARGKTLADLNLNNVGGDRLDDLCFKNALQSGGSYLSPILFEKQGGAAYFCLAAPARDAQGKILGVWRKSYSANEIQSIVANNAGAAGPDSYPIVLERRFRLRLADGGGRADLYKTLVPMSVETNFDLRARNLIPQGAPDELSSNLADFEAAFAQADAQPLFAAKTRAGDATLHQAAVAPMKTQPWTVVFVQPQRVFLQPVAAQTRYNLTTMLLIALLAAGLGLYVSQSIAEPILRLTETAERIHAGDLSALAQVESRDEIGKLAAVFNDMILQLRGFINLLEQRVAKRAAALEKARAESEAARARLEEQIWLADGQNHLAEAARGEQTAEGLAKKTLAALCPYIGAQAGALFLLEENRKLALAGTYCYVAREGFDGYFELGQGLVGQAAADGAIMSVAFSDALVIVTGLGDLPVRKISALPFGINDKLVGVAELATLSDFEPRVFELWNRVSETLGYAFYAVQTRQTLSRMLEESRRQAEELQAREDELRAVNEELQAQAERLADSAAAKGIKKDEE